MTAGAALARLRAVPPSVAIAALVALLLVLSAAGAPLLAPFDPTDIRTFNLADSEIPPLFAADVSIAIGSAAVTTAMLIGVTLGLVAGYAGGRIDAAIMRVGDVILSFPTILLALLVAGLARALLPGADSARLAPFVLVGAIAVHDWVQYARTVRAATMVESAKDYVKAARVIGLPSARILLRHILPNVAGPVLVIATIHLAGAVLTEATLSFLGVGMPPTYPSLGTLIRIGNEFVFSGIWWIATLPALTLVILVLAVNVVGDWLRDRFNPKLRGRR